MQEESQANVDKIAVDERTMAARLIAQEVSEHDMSVVAETSEETIIPVVVEEATVQVHQVERGSVRIQKHVESYQETVDLPLTTETVTVERVPVHAFVEGDAPQMREENGVIVIPVLEEVLVVEKRLFLREEVRLTRQTSTSNSPQTVTLRRETVEVERRELDDEGHSLRPAVG